jgi:hypothetical protein
VFRRDLVDADQLRKLAQFLLALILERARVTIRRSRLNLQVELRDRRGQRVDLARYARRFLIE